MSLDEVTQDLTELTAAMDEHDHAVVDAGIAQLAFIAQTPDSKDEKARLKDVWQAALDHVQATREAERALVARAAGHSAVSDDTKATGAKKKG